MSDGQKWAVSLFMSHIIRLGAFMTAFALVAGVAWSVLRNEIIDVARALTGTDEIAETMVTGFERTDAQIVALTGLVEANSRAIQQINPPRVAEYDERRSRVFGPCVRGMKCEVVYRVRRTDLGRACQAPTLLSRAVVDSSGQIHSALVADSKPPHQIGGEWELIYIAFVMPERMPLGLTEFFLQLAYECPEGRLVEESPPLEFEAVEMIAP